MTPHRVVHILGGEYVHIKAIGSTPIPLQSSINFIPCMHFCVHGLLNEGGYYCINPGEHVHVHTIHTIMHMMHTLTQACIRTLSTAWVMSKKKPRLYTSRCIYTIIICFSNTHCTSVHHFSYIILLSYIQVYPLSDVIPRRHCWDLLRRKCQ